MHIQEIRLLTLDLAQTRVFYEEELGLPVTNNAQGEIVIQVGTSRLVFAQGEQRDQQTSYHFAFNIPENQLEAGMAWAAERAHPLTDTEGTQQLTFGNWDAHACYFDDPAGNILELIARHSLDNASDAPFTSQSLLNISEIGMPVDDVQGTVEAWCKQLGVTVFRGSQSAEFTAIGDDDGLLIIVRQGRLWYPDLRVRAEDRPLAVKVSNAGQEHSL